MHWFALLLISLALCILVSIVAFVTWINIGNEEDLTLKKGSTLPLGRQRFCQINLSKVSSFDYIVLCQMAV